jgi:DNA-directed RNA polymerase subunit RPC12/RpoP
MDKKITFDCPSCAAPVYVDATELTVRCEYCGNNLMVPEELRAAPIPSLPEFQHTVVISMGALGETQNVIKLAPQAAPATQKRRRGLGCWVAGIVFLLIASTLASVALGVWAAFAPLKLDLFNFNIGIPGISGATPDAGFATKSLVFGGRGVGPGMFQTAVDLTVDGSGDIYVAEQSNGRVQRFNAQGVYLNGWVVEGEHPAAIAADRSSGSVFVVTHDKVHRYEGTSGTLLSTFDTKPISFFPPEDLALYPNGDLLVYTSGEDDDVVRLSPDGKEVNRFKKVLTGVYGKVVAPPPWLVDATLDGLENILILNKSSTPASEVLRYSPAGKYMTRFGASANNGSGFSFAEAMAVDKEGRIYVGDLKGIHVFDKHGNFKDMITLQPGETAEGMEATAQGDLLVITSYQQVIKFTPKEAAQDHPTP